ncbi:Trypanosomal VSG domain containing protein, putative [Trypanosoma equiperdum]|uniref:Trypanosomal VSG domain containing protein, putative n=1 Tax=Trypanosoma equiperdum TaxID=5694 RepID=A0A1G4I5H5_TRYEQ|nr:Trypanosomal VSG domain containing protein, putative [Trypanosoma equiperdum]
MKRLSILVFVLAASAALRTQANVAPGENAVPAAAICEIIALAEADLPLPPGPPDTTTDLAELLALNMTVAPENWQKMADKIDPSDTSDQIKQKAALKTTAEADNFNIRWKQWGEARKATNKTGEVKYNLDKLGYTSLTEAEKQTIADRVKTAAEQAAHFADKLAQLKPKLDNAELQAAHSALKEAAFGDSEGTIANVQIAKVFGSTNANTRPNACSGNLNAGAAKTLAAVLTCICAESDTAHSGACARKVEVTATWAASGEAASAKQATVQGVLKLCRPAQRKVLTADAILKPYASLSANVRTQSGTHYIGSLQASSACDGANTGGVCVKFTDYDPASGMDLNKTPWGGKIATVAAALEAREAVIEEAKALAALIQAAKQQALTAIYQRTQPAAPAQKNQAADGNTQKQGTKEEAAEAEKICSAAENNKEACDKLKDQGGVCKPAKKGEGENQETGGKDGKTNTTGSNSFVINKAPLLLAVLLF